MQPTCPFCAPDQSQIVFKNDSFYARYDIYPVSPGHILLIPFRHVADFFDLTSSEQQDALNLIWEAKGHLQKSHKPAGYNIGINVGPTAGQTVMHVHVHIIPRYTGDMDHPEGGVRGVIPGKRTYRTNPNT